MLVETDQSPDHGGDAPKLRAACENCRQSKVKCNLGGKNTCIRCLRHGLPCRYRVANRSGKPKGSKNRATLRKLGQLQDGKSAFHMPDDGHADPTDKGLQVIEQRYINYGIDRNIEIETQTRESNRQSLSESPRSLQVNTAVNACMLLNESSAVEYTSSYADPLPAPDPMCTQASMSPTFLQKEFITKGLTSFPLSVHIPSALEACECGQALGFHMHRLRHMVADTVHLRFDQSLQATKAALSVCQVFLQCARCHKDNSTLLLSVSALDLTLQLLDYWLSYGPVMSPPATAGGSGSGSSRSSGDDTYGEYEMCADETRRVRRFFLHGRLLQSKEILALLKDVVEMSGGLDGLESSWLQQILRGYETTAEGLLQGMRGCICHCN